MTRSGQAADRIAAIQHRDRPAVDEPVVEPAPARTEPFRQTLDLDPDLYAELQRWRLDAAVSTGRGLISQHEVVYTAVLALVKDETVGRRVRALLAAGGPVPRTRKRASGSPEIRRS